MNSNDNNNNDNKSNKNNNNVDSSVEELQFIKERLEIL